MKVLLIILIILATLYAFRASFMKVDFKRTSPGGIQFINEGWAQALTQAKVENKPVLLDIYATWCGPCKMLKTSTFADKDAGDYYNQHFINVALDGEQPEGEQLAQKFQIRGYPTLIFLSPEGQVLHKSAGYIDADELIARGQKILAERQ